MSEMKCKRCGANENRIHGFCSMECETAWYYEDDIRDLTARIAELEEENERLAQLLHDEMSQLEIATDLGKKMEHWRDTALQLSRNNGEAQAKINALEADYVRVS